MAITATYIGNGAGVSVGPLTINLPSGAAAGDLLVLWTASIGTPANPTFSDTGWTLVDTRIAASGGAGLASYVHSIVVTSGMVTAGNAGTITNGANSINFSAANVKGAGGGIASVNGATIGAGSQSSGGTVDGFITGATVVAPEAGTLAITGWMWHQTWSGSTSTPTPTVPATLAEGNVGAGADTETPVFLSQNSPTAGPFSAGTGNLGAPFIPGPIPVPFAWTGGMTQTVICSASSPPTMPTDIDPTNGSTQDVSAGYAFEAKLNSTDGASLNAYAFRIKTPGGVYGYWDATANDLSGTIVWNPCSVAPGGTLTVSIPSSAISNGNIYNWAMAAQESSDNLQGPFATDSTFTAQVGPGLAITLPGSIVTTSEPVVEWTATPAPGSSLISSRVVVLSAAQFGIGGFDPTDPPASPNTWDSGDIAGSGTSISVGTPLDNGGTYRVYVQITETGALTSSWLYVEFSVSFDSPAGATVDADAALDPGTAQPVMALDLEQLDNYLTADDASAEGSIGTWAARSGCTVDPDPSTDQALDGSHSIKMTSTGTGTMKAGTATGTDGYPVVPGQDVSALASFRSAVTAYHVAVDVEWYDVTGTLLSTSSGTASADTTTGWSPRAEPFTAPAGAAFMAIVAEVQSTASGKVTYVDCAGIFPGTVTEWSAGGFAGVATAVVLRSDGVYVQGASPTNPCPIPSGETVTIYDAFAIPGVEYSYTVQTSVDLGGGTIVTSPASLPSATVSHGTGGAWWILDALDPTTAFSFCAGDGSAKFTPTRHKRMGVSWPFGAQTYVVVNGDVLKPEFDLVATLDPDETTKLDALWESARIVCIKPDNDEQTIYFMAFGPDEPRPMINRNVSQMMVHCYPVRAPVDYAPGSPSDEIEEIDGGTATTFYGPEIDGGSA